MAGRDEMMRRQRVLAEFGDFVLNHEDLDEILNEGCRLIAEALDTPLSKVIEVERGTDTGFVRAGVGWRPGIVGHERVPLSERSSEAYAIQKAEPVITNDIAREDRFAFPAFLRDHGVVALVNVPIFLPGRRPWGVLQVDARKTRKFDQEDIAFLKTYAMVLGPVIDRARVAAERELARAGLAEREERQAFLLRLSDALRPLARAEDIQAVACRMLGERLGASWAYYVSYHPEEGCGIVSDAYRTPGLPSLAGRYPFEAFRSTYERLAQGAAWIVPDVTCDPGLPAAERDFYAARDVRAWVDVPLAKAQSLQAALCVVQTAPRSWTPSEISLIEEVAERLWAEVQRGLAETALRESETRLAAAFESVPVGVAVMDACGGAQIANAEFLRFLPTGRIPSLDGEGLWRWAAWDAEGCPLQPQDFPGPRALRGERVVPGHEMLFTNDQGRQIWTSVATTPIRDEAGEITGLAAVITDIDSGKRAIERQRLLLAELQHRVRNILAMVRSIVRRTVETGDNLEEVAAHLDGRLASLARTQTLLTRTPGAGVSLETLIREELLAQHADEEAIELTGPEVEVAPKAAEVLTLAIHELGTNATKYGAFAQPGASLQVRWSLEPAEDGEDRLRLVWQERGVRVIAAQPRRLGFGTELVRRRVPYELRGTGALELLPGGVRAEICFPLAEGASILDTVSPRGVEQTGEEA